MSLHNLFPSCLVMLFDSSYIGSPSLKVNVSSRNLSTLLPIFRRHIVTWLLNSQTFCTRNFMVDYLLVATAQVHSKKEFHAVASVLYTCIGAWRVGGFKVCCKEEENIWNSIAQLLFSTGTESWEMMETPSNQTATRYPSLSSQNICGEPFWILDSDVWVPKIKRGVWGGRFCTLFLK